MKAGYLQKIHKGYTTFIENETDLNTLIVDVSGLDFINNYSHYKVLMNKIESSL